jgi:DNA modification methylase
LSQIDNENGSNNGFEEVKEGKAQRLNDLDGATWLQWSKSIWRFKTPVVDNFGHPAIFPDFVAERLIKIFTREQDLVLDPMAGVGTTLFVAKTLLRNSIGLELSPKFCEIAKSRLKQQVFPKEITGELIQKVEAPVLRGNKNTYSHRIICDDARNLLTHLSQNSVDFCLTSPPYWIGLHGINGKYTGQTQKEWKVYSENEKDYGNIEDYQKFVDELRSLFSNVFAVLKGGKYCAVIIQDSRRGSTVYPLHMDFCNAMKSIGYSYQDLIVWEHPTYTTRPLGYPTTFVISRVHDFIMVFRKPKQ